MTLSEKVVIRVPLLTGLHLCMVQGQAPGKKQ